MIRKPFCKTISPAINSLCGNVAGYPAVLDDFLNDPAPALSRWTISRATGIYYNDVDEPNWAFQPASNVGVIEAQYGVPQGLLNEYEQTNLTKQSEEFENGSWFRSAQYTSHPTALSLRTIPIRCDVPTGGANGIEYSTDTINCNSPRQYSAFIEFKPASGNTAVVSLDLRIANAAGTSYGEVNVNLSNDALTTAVAGTGYTDPIAWLEKIGTWYRLHLTVKVPVGNLRMEISANDGGGGPNWPANSSDGITGDGIWYGPRQIEFGPTSTSYIRTETSNPARAASRAFLTQEMPNENFSWAVVIRPRFSVAEHQIDGGQPAIFTFRAASGPFFNDYLRAFWTSADKIAYQQVVAGSPKDTITATVVPAWANQERLVITGRKSDPDGTSYIGVNGFGTSFNALDDAFGAPSMASFEVFGRHIIESVEIWPENKDDIFLTSYTGVEIP